MCRCSTSHRPSSTLRSPLTPRTHLTPHTPFTHTLSLTPHTLSVSLPNSIPCVSLSFPPSTRAASHVSVRILLIPYQSPFIINSLSNPFHYHGFFVTSRFNSSPSSCPLPLSPAMELARHYPSPHPLSQTYRPVLPGPGAGPYLPPHSPYISVRIDHTGMPFVDWGMVRVREQSYYVPCGRLNCLFIMSLMFSTLPLCTTHIT